MQQFIYFLLAGLFMSACSRPTAKFRVVSSEMAPAKIHAYDESENTDSIAWYFEGKRISSDSSLYKEVLMSGQYNIQLKAYKGKKSSIMNKEVYIDPPTDCLVELETPFGNMLIKLYDDTPGHRDNFIKLVEENYYDGLLFHRVISNFMVQGGDPNSKDSSPGQRLGSGGPGYQIDAEFVPELVHIKGSLAAARTGDAVNPKRKSSGSQFYIVHGTKMTSEQLDQMEQRMGIQYSEDQRTEYMEVGGTPFLDYQYTVFGRIVKGLEVLDKIAEVNTDSGDRPKEDIAMHLKVIK